MRKFRIELDDFDLGQVLDGLEARAAIWEKTAEHHRTGEAEAAKIGAHYRLIIAKIRKQHEEQL